MMSKVKERAEKLIRELPDDVVQELLEDLEDALALAKAKEEDTDKLPEELLSEGDPRHRRSS